MKSPVNKNYRVGQFLQSKKQFEHTDPVDGSIVTMVAEAGREMVDNAVQAGREALQDERGAFSAADRARLLHALADGMPFLRPLLPEPWSTDL